MTSLDVVAQCVGYYMYLYYGPQGCHFAVYMSIRLLCHICPPMCHTWKKCCMNIQYIHHYGLPRKQQHYSEAVTKANRMLGIIL